MIGTASSDSTDQSKIWSDHIVNLGPWSAWTSSCMLMILASLKRFDPCLQTSTWGAEIFSFACSCDAICDQPDHRLSLVQMAADRRRCTSRTQAAAGEPQHAKAHVFAQGLQSVLIKARSGRLLSGVWFDEGHSSVRSVAPRCPPCRVPLLSQAIADALEHFYRTWSNASKAPPAQEMDMQAFSRSIFQVGGCDDACEGPNGVLFLMLWGRSTRPLSIRARSTYILLVLVHL